MTKETMAIVAVDERSPEVGIPLGALEVTIIAHRDREVTIETIPGPGTVVQSGDDLFVIANPEKLRVLESLEGGRLNDPSAVSEEPIARGIDLEPGTASD